MVTQREQEDGRRDEENRGDTSLYLTVTKLQVTKTYDKTHDIMTTAHVPGYNYVSTTSVAANKNKIMPIVSMHKLKLMFVQF